MVKIFIEQRVKRHCKVITNHIKLDLNLYKFKLDSLHKPLNDSQFPTLYTYVKLHLAWDGTATEQSFVTYPCVTWVHKKCFEREKRRGNWLFLDRKWTGAHWREFPKEPFIVEIESCLWLAKGYKWKPLMTYIVWMKTVRLLLWYELNIAVLFSLLWLFLQIYIRESDLNLLFLVATWTDTSMDLTVPIKNFRKQ